MKDIYMGHKLKAKKMDELVLLKMTSYKDESTGEVTIKAITPVSTVELTTTEEIALQVFTQLGKRLLETIESELIELKGDMETNSSSYEVD